MLIGYARVSTEDQDPTLQIRALEEYGCERIYTDKASGKNLQRPEWKRCRRDLRGGDTLVVWKLDRLARSVLDLHKIAEEFKTEGIDLVVTTQAIDTRTAAGRFLFTILGAVAEMERELISERTKAGIAQRKAEGARLGGMPKITPEIWAAAREIIKDHAERGEPISPYRLAELLEESGHAIKRPVLNKWKDRLYGDSDDYPEDWAERLKQRAERQKAAAKAARKR